VRRSVPLGGKIFSEAIRKLLSPKKLFEELDPLVVEWMAKHGLPTMRIGLGVVFLWFGVLKLFPGLSPAEELVRQTTYFVDPDIFLPVLAIWESLIGVGLILGAMMRLTLMLLFVQLLGTALPLFILPEVVWSSFPLGLTLEGQYIIKNLVLIGAALVLGGTVRGGRIDPSPTQD